MTTDQKIEQEIQAKGLTQRSHVKCQGDRCMSINGRGHSRECIQEAARVQGWTPSEGDFSECGPSAPITESTIEQEIEAKGLTAPRVTPADIEANIASTVYFTAFQGFKGNDDTDDQSLATCDALRLLTFCVLVLRNGFTVTGESACASPENFDAEIGRKIARANAVQKIWPLMGYALKDQLSQAKQPAQSPEDSCIYKEKVEMIDKELVTLVSISKKGGSEVYKGIGRANSFAQRKLEAFKAFELDKPTPKPYQWSDVEFCDIKHNIYTNSFEYVIRTKDGGRYTGIAQGQYSAKTKQAALDDCNRQRNNT